MMKTSNVSIYCEPQISKEVFPKEICKFVSDTFPVHVDYMQKTILDKNSMVTAAQIYDLNKPLYKHTNKETRQGQHACKDSHTYDVIDPNAQITHLDVDTKDETIQTTSSQFPMHTKKRSVEPTDVQSKPMSFMYDGFMLCQIADQYINQFRAKQHTTSQNRGHTLDIILTDILACTFDHTDNRYHARTIIGANPFVISIQGIIDGPARSKEYYIKRMINQAITSHGGPHLKIDDAIKTDTHECEYITRNDSRIPQIVQGLLLQSIVYYETGQSFCTDDTCRMYNAHWQKDLVRTQVINPRLCDVHKKIIHNMQK